MLNRSLRTILILTAAALPLLVTAACTRTETAGARTAPAQPAPAQTNEQLAKSFDDSKKAFAARVNGEPVAEFFVLREMNAIGPAYLKSGQKRTPEIDAKVRRHALDIVVFQTLAVQEAKKRGMKIEPEFIDREVKKIRTDAGSEAAFQEYLARNGLSEAELRKVMEREYLFELIAAHEIEAKITVTEADIRQRYEQEQAAAREAGRKQVAFEEAKGQVEHRARVEAAEKRMRAWEQELRQGARIETLG